MAKILGVQNLLQKKFNYLEGLPENITRSFGELVTNFIMILWGKSGNGKSNLVMQLIKILVKNGKVLYVSLEEGHEASIVKTVKRHLIGDEFNGKIHFADHEMKYDKLVAVLAKKKSANFVIIDSIQYWKITYEQYQELKERFKKKSFIFISHAKGKNPKGNTAENIMYDAGIKVHVEGYVANVISRYGGNQPFTIWHEGAQKYWGKKFHTVTTGLPDKPAKRARKKKETKSTEPSKEAA